MKLSFARNLWWIFVIIMTTGLVACFYSSKHQAVETRPNVLLIFTDQQNINMMSAAGNPNLNTPAMDKIAGQGVMFMQSYCTSPVCGPARSSIISGRMPHETGVEWNGDEMKEDILNAGEIFRNSGYYTVWGGKWHLPESYPQRAKAKQKNIKGFDMLPFRDPDLENWMLGTETDPPLTEAVVRFLDEYDQKQPFFLAVSYHNPHDICFYPRKDGWISTEDSLLEIRYYGFEYKLPDVIGTHPENYTNLPALPENFKASPDELAFIKDKRNHHDEYGLETKLAFQEFNELEWRGYLNAYHRLTKLVDAEIGKVMEALTENNLDGNTIVLFTSDHGDGAASHQWAAKLSLYEESSKVPLIISWKDNITEGIKDHQHLVSQIDILPTLCDYARIDEKPSFTGKSLRKIIEKPASDWRDYLIVELADFKPDPTRKGRMVRTADFKYNVYSKGEDNEQFFNLRNDPGECTNLARNPAYDKEINKHRHLLKEWMDKTGDQFSGKIGAQ
jgi:arylsulfatase A-like enzyme